MTHKSRKPLRASFAFLSLIFLVGDARLWLSARAVAAEANPVGVVSHVKVLSNRVEDVSSPAAWAATSSSRA